MFTKGIKGLRGATFTHKQAVADKRARAAEVVWAICENEHTFAVPVRQAAKCHACPLCGKLLSARVD